MKRLLKGGAVASGNGVVRADVLIDGEKIAAIGLNLPEEGVQVEDMTEKLLLPGFIDAHTHFDLDVAGTTTADDFASGTRSAPPRGNDNGRGFCVSQPWGKPALRAGRLAQKGRWQSRL